ncbi:TPA: response regulator [Escherichia coli]|nr:response regulator [Escherichia coli]
MSSIITIVVLVIVLLIAVGFIIKSQKEQKRQMELKRLQVIQSKTMSKKNKAYTPGNPESEVNDTPVLQSAAELKNPIKPVKQKEDILDSSTHLEQSVADIAHSKKNLLNIVLDDSEEEKEDMDLQNYIAPNRTVDEKMTVLLVDDSKSSLFSAKRALEGEYNIVTAINGIDALEKMEIMLPALVVTDIEMPGLDGFGLVQRMKGDIKLTEIPIIMVTANINKVVQIGQDKGVQGFLTKPYKPEDLLEQVNYLLDR